MKKLFCGFLCLLLALLPLAGCGAEPEPARSENLIYAIPGVAFGMTIDEACAALGWKPEEAEVSPVTDGQGEETGGKSYRFTGKKLWDIPMEWVYLRCEEGAAPLDRGIVEAGVGFSSDRTREVVEKAGETIGAMVADTGGETPELFPPQQADVFTVREWDRLRQELISVRKVFGELPVEAMERQTEEEVWDGIMENEKASLIVGVYFSPEEESNDTSALTMRGVNAAMLNRMRVEKD